MVLTTCPFCACGCGLYLHTDDGRPDGTTASEHHPVSQSRLCVRGQLAHEAPAWGERLETPLVRRGGRLERTSWDEALAAAAAGLRSARAAGATIGVLGSARATNEESYLAARLARGVLATPHLDACLGAPHRALLAGLGRVSGWRGGRGTIADVAAADAVLLVEGDIASSHPQVAGAVMRARARGARVVVVGAVATKMAQLATTWLRVTPGREREVTAALVAAVLAEGRLDAAAVGAPGGLAALRASVAGASVDDEVRRAAAWYSQARTAATLLAPAAGTEADSADLAADLATLAVITGHWDRPGSPLLPLPPRGNLRGAIEAGVSPVWLPGCADLDDAGAVRRLAALWGGSPCCDRGLDAATLAGGADALVVVAEELPAVLPGARGMLEHWPAERFLVVLEAFATRTAAAASVVLPVASFAENAGTVTNLEGRVQRVRPAVPPPGEARPGWEVLAELCRRLGAEVGLGSTEAVRDELAAAVPRWAAASGHDLDDGWGALLPAPPRAPGAALAGLAPLPTAPGAAAAVAFADNELDWGMDPLVRWSPTLCRDSVAHRKLYPRGAVVMSREALDAIGARPGWPVRVTSAAGEAVVPALVGEDLRPGLVAVPAACRDGLLAVMGTDGIVAVSVARA